MGSKETVPPLPSCPACGETLTWPGRVRPIGTFDGPIDEIHDKGLGEHVALLYVRKGRSCATIRCLCMADVHIMPSQEHGSAKKVGKKAPWAVWCFAPNRVMRVRRADP